MVTPRANHRSFTEMMNKTSLRWARRRLGRHISWWGLSMKRSSNHRRWARQGARTTTSEHGEFIYDEIQLPQLHRARIPAASQDELARRGTRTTAASPSSFPPMISSESMVWLTGGRGGGADSFCLRRLSCLLRQFSCRKFHFIHDNDKGYEIDRVIIILWSCLTLCFLGFFWICFLF